MPAAVASKAALQTRSRCKNFSSGKNNGVVDNPRPLPGRVLHTVDQDGCTAG
jgi:hypothetical protein